MLCLTYRHTINSIVLREFWNLPEQLIAWSCDTVITYSALGALRNYDQSWGKVDYWVYDAEHIFQKQLAFGPHLHMLCCLIRFLVDLDITCFVLLYGSFSFHSQFFSENNKRNCFSTAILSLIPVFSALKKYICKQKQRHSFS